MCYFSNLFFLSSVFKNNLFFNLNLILFFQFLGEFNESIPELCECLIGSFAIELINEEMIDFPNIDVINKQLLYLYCKQIPLETLIYYECNESQTGKHFSIKLKSNNNNLINHEFIESLNCSQFLLTTNLLINNNNEIVVDVWLQKSALKFLSFNSQTFLRINYNVLRVMNHFYDFPLPIDNTNDGKYCIHRILL
jgi:hypothetical protein